MPSITPTPLKTGVVIKQGKSFRFPFQWKINGVAQDLTGGTVRSQLRAGDARNVSKLVDFTARVTDAPIAIGELLLTDLQTAVLRVPGSVCDIEAVLADGTVEAIGRVKFTLEYESTRSESESEATTPASTADIAGSTTDPIWVFDTGLGTVTETTFDGTYPALFEVDDLGADQQLTRLRGNGVDLFFDELPSWRILLFSKLLDSPPGSTATDPRTTYVGPDAFSSPPTVTAVSDTVTTIEWTQVNLGTVKLRFSLDEDTGALTCTWDSLELNGVSAAVYSIWAFDFPRLQLKPIRNTAAHAMTLVGTQFGGILHHGICNPTANGEGQELPNVSSSIQSYPLSLTTLHAADLSVTQSMPWAYCYDRDLEKGLRIRVKDGVIARQHMIFAQGSTDAVDLWVRHFPPNNVGDVATKTVNAATNATPIELTFTTNHSYSVGETIVVASVGGNTAANGIWTVASVPAANKVTLTGSVGNGVYTTGGTAKRIPAVSWVPSDYSTTLLPTKGCPEQVAKAYGEELEEEVAAVLSRGKVWRFPGDKTPGQLTRFPTHVVNTRAILWYAIPDFATELASYTTTISRMVADGTRAAAEWGSGKVMMLIHGVGPHAIGTKAPDVSPMPQLMVDAITTLAAAGVNVYAYVIPFYVDSTSDWAAANPGYTAYQILDRDDQAAVLVDLSPNDHSILNPDYALARAAFVTQIDSLFDELAADTEVVGLYMDAVGRSLIPDYRNTLAASKLGVGAGTWHTALRAFITELATTTGVRNTSIATASEFADETLLDRLHWHTVWTANILAQGFAGLWTHAPIFRAALGQYCCLFNFNCVDQVSPAVASSLWAATVEIRRWGIARNWLCGAIPAFSSFNTTGMPFFVESGESNYATWLSVQKPINDLMSDMIATEDMSIGGTEAYVKRGKMLRPLADSFGAWFWRHSFAELYAVAIGALLNGDESVIGGTRTDSNVFFDEEYGTIGIIIVNFRASEETCHILMDPDDYAPYMEGTRYLVQTVNNVRTLIATSDRGFDETVTVPAGSVAVYEILPDSPE
jgi:hypothetical protein